MSNATPLCINYVLRNATVIIAKLRNLKSHSTESNWIEIEKGNLPSEFKFCGKTYDDFWKVCEEAVRDVLKYLKSKGVIDDEKYNEKDHAIYQIQHMTENEQFMAVNKASYKELSETLANAKRIIDELKAKPKSLVITVEVKNIHQKPKSFLKRFFPNKRKQNQLFQGYFDFTDYLDSPIVTTIKNMLTQVFEEEQGLQNNQSIKDYEIRPSRVDTDTRVCREDTLKIEVCIKPPDDSNLDRYQKYDSGPSIELWGKFSKSLADDVLQKTGQEVEIKRSTWNLGSIVTTLLVTKVPGNAWNVIEKNNIVTLITELSLHRMFWDYRFTADFCIPEDRKEGVAIQYSVDIYNQDLIQNFMDVYPGFKGKLQAKFAALKMQLEKNHGLYGIKGMCHSYTLYEKKLLWNLISRFRRKYLQFSREINLIVEGILKVLWKSLNHEIQFWENIPQVVPVIIKKKSLCVDNFCCLFKRSKEIYSE